MLHGANHLRHPEKAVEGGDPEQRDHLVLVSRLERDPKPVGDLFTKLAFQLHAEQVGIFEPRLAVLVTRHPLGEPTGAVDQHPVVPATLRRLLELTEPRPQGAFELLLVDHQRHPLRAGYAALPRNAHVSLIDRRQALDLAHAQVLAAAGSTRLTSISTTPPPARAWIRPSCLASNATGRSA